MPVSTILNTGMLSMQSSMNRTAIASSGLNVENSRFIENMVGLNQAGIDAKAAADVIKIGDEMLGTLIDIRA